MSAVRGGTRRTRLFVGVALCVTLVALVGCPDDGGNGGDGGSGATPDTAPPVIILTGSEFIVLAIGDTFTDEGAAVSDNDPAYTAAMATPLITNDVDPANTPITTIDTATAGVYTITYTAPADVAGNSPTPVTRTVRVGEDADSDNRMDINFLEDLDAVCTDTAGVHELTRDLDFADGDSYADGTVNADWRPDATDPDSATNAGWAPIGTGGGADSFSGSFFGNGFVIANLYVRRNDLVGLFGANSGAIQRIGVVDVNIYGEGTNNAVGGLVGENGGGTITASYATGDVDGGAGESGGVGGLVGANTNGTITASYATADVDGGAGVGDLVGGLVGNSGTSTITASYATGNVNGGEGLDLVGGLVGNIDAGAITASYATGNVNREAGSDIVGGLVGQNSGGTITASYGFGTVTGGTVGTPRSTDASPPATVANACALTQANSSTTPANRWDTAQWDFGTAVQRPIVLHEGEPVRGQEDRDC